MNCAGPIPLGRATFCGSTPRLSIFARRVPNPIAESLGFAMSPQTSAAKSCRPCSRPRWCHDEDQTTRPPTTDNKTTDHGPFDQCVLSLFQPEQIADCVTICRFFQAIDVLPEAL